MTPRQAAMVLFAAGVAGIALAASAQQRPIFTAARSPAAPGQSQPLAVDWKGASQQARGALNQRGQRANIKVIAANRAKIDTVAIPVLLPGDPDLAANLRFFPNGAFYTASSSSNGMSFVITGSGRGFPLGARTVRGLPGGDLKSRIPADGILIAQTEAGLDASFSRFGVSYSISLECASRTDTRCTDEGYVRGVIARMTVVVPGGHG